MKIMMAAVMQPTEMVHITKMAARPVTCVEMAAANMSAAHQPVSPQAADAMSGTGRAGYYVANTAVSHSGVTDIAVTHCAVGETRMASAGVCPPTVASYMTSTTMATAGMT